jgi:site-specific DNA recombinase
MSRIKTKQSTNSGTKKRMALYARVSTQEQTRGQYPSCESQIEEMEAACRARGWHVQETITDEGLSAGSLNRRGLNFLRHLVETDQIDGVICTWYDRLTRSRDFYVLDKEFKAHNVELITLHDPTDRHTASGRFLETMLVAAKTYEREQTGEKVRTKLRMRAEKGLWNGGLVPFGFLCDAKEKTLFPDPEKAPVVRQLFEVYVETRSDFAVRDWLKRHQIPAPGSNPVWSVGTIRDLLTNRRYIAEVEINRSNKGKTGLPESDAYRIVKASYEPLVPREMWELAQALREEKACAYPNHTGENRGNARSYSWSKDQRVYPLQGLLTCSICHSLMTPHYVFHKAGKNRRKDSFVNYYVCTKHRKYGTDCDHRNRILARVVEEWVMERIKDFAALPHLLEISMQQALRRSEKNLQPLQEALARTRSGLQETEKQIEILMNTLTTGTASPTLMQMVNERAGELQQQRHALRADERRLLSQLAPLQHKPEAAALHRALSDISLLMENAEPEELQRLLQMMVRCVKWNPDGRCSMQVYN